MISTCRPCIHVLETNQGYLCVLTFYKAVITFTENVQCSLKAYLCLFKTVWNFVFEICVVI